MLNSVDDFLNRIDNLAIYEKDYHILNSLLGLDHDIFIKILEEILLGTIYIGDLEAIFDDNTYKDLLSTELESQEKIQNKQKILIDKLKKASTLRNCVEINNIDAISSVKKIMFSEKENDELDYFLDNLKNSTLSIPHGKITLEYLKTIPEFENKSRLVELVTKKLSSIIYENFRLDRRDALFYELSKKNNSLLNTSVLKYVKHKFFKLVDTGSFIESELKNNPNNVSFEIVNDGGINKILLQDSTVPLGFIMPDDFLFSVDDPIIPISFDSVVLNENDREYMVLNNLNQDEMKKMKSLYLTIVREDYLRKNLSI